MKHSIEYRGFIIVDVDSSGLFEVSKEEWRDNSVTKVYLCPAGVMQPHNQRSSFASLDAVIEAIDQYLDAQYWPDGTKVVAGRASQFYCHSGRDGGTAVYFTMTMTMEASDPGYILNVVNQHGKPQDFIALADRLRDVCEHLIGQKAES